MNFGTVLIKHFQFFLFRTVSTRFNVLGTLDFWRGLEPFLTVPICCNWGPHDPRPTSHHANFILTLANKCNSQSVMIEVIVRAKIRLPTEMHVKANPKWTLKLEKKRNWNFLCTQMVFEDLKHQNNPLFSDSHVAKCFMYFGI